MKYRISLKPILCGKQTDLKIGEGIGVRCLKLDSHVPDRGVGTVVHQHLTAIIKHLQMHFLVVGLLQELLQRFLNLQGRKMISVFFIKMASLIKLVWHIGVDEASSCTVANSSHHRKVTNAILQTKYLLKTGKIYINNLTSNNEFCFQNINQSSGSGPDCSFHSYKEKKDFL